LAPRLDLDTLPGRLPWLDRGDLVSAAQFDSSSMPANPVDFDSFDATLQQIVDLARLAIANCSMAGLTLLDRTGPYTAVATSEVAGQVDAVQYEVGSGPCLDAYRQQVVHRIPSTRSDSSWPEFSRRAAENGVLATLSHPLLVGGDGMGALNLYADHEGAFANDEQAAQVFATHASITLSNARAYWRNEALRQNLEAALETRGVIERAKGLIMAREGMTEDQAFEVLVQTSQRENRKVHDIAAEILTSAE
jgi:GAF domain-containing protein